MNMEDWKTGMKGCKTVTTMTGFFKVKCFKHNDHTYSFARVNKCKCCGTELAKHKVMVEFNNPIKLSLFQAELLYMVFTERKRPHDYARYHECPAGKEFVANLNKVEVVPV